MSKPTSRAYSLPLTFPALVTCCNPASPPARSRGWVRTYATDGQGKETVLGFTWEGWWCGDVANAVASSPVSLSLQALEATDVLQLSLKRLEQLCQHIPAFERFFRLLFQNAFLLEQRQRLALLHCWPLSAVPVSAASTPACASGSPRSTSPP